MPVGKRKRPPGASPASSSGQHQVASAGRAKVAGAGVAELAEIESAQQVLAAAEQQRADRQLQLIQEARFELLTDRLHATAEPDVFAARGSSCALECDMNPLRDEVKGRAA
jgi:hypothetical protein